MKEPEVPRRIILQIDGSIGHRAELERAIGHVRPGTVVQSFEDPRAAIDYLARCGNGVPMPDCVLLSRMLRDTDSYEVLREVRALAHLSSLPVILVHSDNQQEDMERALALGAAAYLRKPTEKQEYARFAAEIIAWQARKEEQEMLQGWCAVPAHAGSLPGNPLIESPSAMLIPLPNPPAPTVLPESPLTQMQHLLQNFFGYIAGGGTLATAGLYADRKLVEISRACREEGIEEALALGRSQDPVIALKRGRVIRRLMTLEWADTELLARFAVRKRTIAEQRRLWRQEQRKCCVVAAPGQG